jgi:hypothetical protein
MPKKKIKENTAIKILNHPNLQEIIAKLASDVSCANISEALKYQYESVSEQQFQLSEKVLQDFKDNYFDFYNIIKQDVVVLKSGAVENHSTGVLSAYDELQQQMENNPTYFKILEKYAENEVDIKMTVRRLIASAELRISQMFDLIQEDPRSFKPDRTLVEWFNTLSNILEKYDTILNGTPDQINIQNNISINMVDTRIQLVYNIIKTILERLDYDTSLQFIELFNSEMSKLESPTTSSSIPPPPQETRLQEAKILDQTITTKLNKPLF